jgi:hypothetical protein
MKKLLVLVAVLALVAAMVVPLAASATPAGAPQAGALEFYGAMIAPTIALTVPTGPVAFGPFAPGRNPAVGTVNSPGDGDVILTQNSDANASFTLTVTSTNDGNGNFTDGKMYCTALHRYMTDAMWVNINDGTLSQLAGGVSMSSSTPGHNYFKVGAAQVIETADGAAGAGDYYIFVVVTAQCNY